jgi:hypothetical protein
MWKRFIERMETRAAHQAAAQLRQMGMYREADEVLKNIK